MPKWALAVYALAAIQVIWILFVSIYVGTLTEIRKSCWHYKLYCKMPWEKEPRDSCQYRRRLMLFPPFCVGIAIALVIAAVIVFCRLAFHWIIMPLVAGRIPDIRSVWEYSAEVIEPGTQIWSKSFMPGSPLLFLCLAGFAYELYRVSGGTKGPVETYTTLGILVAGIAVIGTVLIVKRPSVKHLWETLRERFCTQLPIKD